MPLPPLARADDIIATLRPGMTVFVGGVAGEPLALRAALAANPEAAAGVTFVGAWLPGLNEFDYAGLHPQAASIGLFVTRAQRESFTAGRHRFLPVSYYGFAEYLRRRDFDQAWIQVAPARPDGLYPLGLNADYADVVRARTVVGEVNHNLAIGPRATTLARVDAIVESDVALPESRAPAETPEAAALGAHVAGLIADGDTIQIGIGALPSAVLRRLGAHRDLGLHSGIISDACVELIDAGVITGRRKGIDEGLAVAAAAIGTSRLYDALARDDIVLRESTHVHAPGTLARVNALVSLNSALEVDLLGQVNATSIAGRLVSGMGGFLDFARGARSSVGGRAIVMLPARAKGESRIVARFAPGTPVTASAQDIDLVVTEHGAARLAGLDWDARASALVGIAAPEHRESLAAAWHEMRNRM
jgi:acyl-CoA hydrolase